MKKPHSYSISVVGHANHPGRYELQRQTTVLEAIALAGVSGSFGSYSGVFVLRNDGKEAKRIPFDYGAATSDAASAANFYLPCGRYRGRP